MFPFNHSDKSHVRNEALILTSFAREEKLRARRLSYEQFCFLLYRVQTFNLRTESRCALATQKRPKFAGGTASEAQLFTSNLQYRLLYATSLSNVPKHNELETNCKKKILSTDTEAERNSVSV